MSNNQLMGMQVEKTRFTPRALMILLSSIITFSYFLPILAEKYDELYDNKRETRFNYFDLNDLLSSDYFNWVRWLGLAFLVLMAFVIIFWVFINDRNFRLISTLSTVFTVACGAILIYISIYYTTNKKFQKYEDYDDGDYSKYTIETSAFLYIRMAFLVVFLVLSILVLCKVLRWNSFKKLNNNYNGIQINGMVNNGYDSFNQNMPMNNFNNQPNQVNSNVPPNITSNASAQGVMPNAQSPQPTPQPIKSYCINCGAKLDPGVRFCSKCGKEI